MPRMPYMSPAAIGCSSGQVARMAFRGEARAERSQHLVRTAQPAGGADRHHIAVPESALTASSAEVTLLMCALRALR